MRDKLWTVFMTFMKIGAFTFGGGYAMIPLIQHEIVDQKAYITEKEFMNMIAIAEATPGVIAVNTATFVGYKVCGILGGIVATAGVVLPSFIIITIISQFYAAFRTIQWIDWAFSGIRAGVIVLIIGALVRMLRHNDRNSFVFALMVIAFVMASFTAVNVVWVIIGGAIAGLIRQLIVCKREEREDEHLS